MEADEPTGSIAPFRFRRRAMHPAGPCGRQRATHHSGKPFERADSASEFQHSDGSDLEGTGKFFVLDRSAPQQETGSIVGGTATPTRWIGASHCHLGALLFIAYRLYTSRAGDYTTATRAFGVAARSIARSGHLCRGRHCVWKPFRPNSGDVRIAAARVIADRRVRTALVHVSGAHWAR